MKEFEKTNPDFKGFFFYKITLIGFSIRKRGPRIAHLLNCVHYIKANNFPLKQDWFSVVDKRFVMREIRRSKKQFRCRFLKFIFKKQKENSLEILKLYL